MLTEIYRNSDSGLDGLEDSGQIYPRVDVVDFLVVPGIDGSAMAVSDKKLAAVVLPRLIPSSSLYVLPTFQQCALTRTRGVICQT